MATTKKIYDFPFEKVKSQVVTALKKSQGRATVADLTTRTGLPLYQVSKVLPAIVDDCRGELQVTESGEIIYHFPRGLSSRKPGLGRRIWSGVTKVLQALFKAWIVVMLVGYFLLFVLVLLIALVVAIALSFARRDDRDEGGAEGVLGFFLVTRVLEFFLLFWLFSGDPEYKQKKKKKPFFKAVFDYVFGVADKPEVWEKRERKAMIAYVQSRQGLITLEEFMILTGRSREESQALLSRYMLEFDGEPQVSDSGTLYYAFPALLKTTAPEISQYVLPEQDLIPFTRNTPGTNGWIAFLNGFNIVLGGYFVAFSLSGGLTSTDSLAFVYQVAVVLLAAAAHMPVAQAQSLVFWILGIIPAVYSGFFFGIPLVRRILENKTNQTIQARNLSRKIDRAVWEHPQQVDLDILQPDSEKNAPGKPGDERNKIKERLFRDFAGSRSIEVVQKPQGGYHFQVSDVDREKQDMAQLRRDQGAKAPQLGQIVYDTQSDKLPE